MQWVLAYHKLGFPLLIRITHTLKKKKKFLPLLLNLTYQSKNYLNPTLIHIVRADKHTNINDAKLLSFRVRISLLPLQIMNITHDGHRRPLKASLFENVPKIVTISTKLCTTYAFLPLTKHYCFHCL